MSEELKPCPFCGGEAKLFDYEAEHDIYHPDTLGFLDTEYYDLWFCICEECGITTPDKRTEAEAVEAWNTRAERTCHWKWVRFGYEEPSRDDYEGWYCSNCGEVPCEYGGSGGIEEPPNFCPNCDAKVVEHD